MLNLFSNFTLKVKMTSNGQNEQQPIAAKYKSGKLIVDWDINNCNKRANKTICVFMGIILFR